MKNKLKLFSVIAISLVVAGVVSAALLTKYVTITGTAADVQQAVVMNNGDAVTYAIEGSAVAGNTYISESFILKNQAEVTVPVKFETTYSPDGEGITTTYWSSVVLEDKDPSTWDANDTNDISATLQYTLVGEAFDYVLNGKVSQAGTEYSLIYYADKPNRFENWGGNNPGKLIGTVTSDSEGNISKEDQIVLGMNLPSPNDANIDEYDYCVEDGNKLCHGAKVWLVPSADYDENTSALTVWNPSNYLFETDLISYGNGDTLYLGTGELDMFVKNELDIAIAPGSYTITTEVQPSE